MTLIHANPQDLTPLILADKANLVGLTETEGGLSHLGCLKERFQITIMTIIERVLETDLRMNQLLALILRGKAQRLVGSTMDNLRAQIIIMTVILIQEKGLMYMATRVMQIWHVEREVAKTLRYIPLLN
jgi:hypothetical protein